MVDWTQLGLVVTGGAGFLGRLVCEKLRQRGCVRIGVPRRAKYDLTTEDGVRRMYADFEPEIVIHLAAEEGGIGANRAHPGRFCYANLAMGLHLIEQGRQHGIQKFVQAGTVCAYPKYASVPFVEDDIWNGFPEETNAPYPTGPHDAEAHMASDTEQVGAVSIIPVLEPPPLEPGDRLTRDEFERRYDATPNLKKAELIEGVVYLPSPVRLQRHGRPHGHLMTWIGTYESGTPGTMMADNASDRLDMDNEPQPDAALFIEPQFGGQAKITDDDYLEGAPELIGEVTSSTVSYDLGDKLEVYRRNSVREYIVWRVLDRALDWFVLRGSVYQRLQSNQQGVVASEVFPGLWLDVNALLAGDLARVLTVLREGLRTQEHAAFVQQLQARGN
jgi:Uma2 family endonuclease